MASWATARVPVGAADERTAAGPHGETSGPTRRTASVRRRTTHRRPMERRTGTRRFSMRTRCHACRRACRRCRRGGRVLAEQSDHSRQRQSPLANEATGGVVPPHRSTIWACTIPWARQLRHVIYLASAGCTHGLGVVRLPVNSSPCWRRHRLEPQPPARRQTRKPGSKQQTQQPRKRTPRACRLPACDDLQSPRPRRVACCHWM